MAQRKPVSFLVFDCIHPGVALRVENRGGCLDSRDVGGGRARGRAMEGFEPSYARVFCRWVRGARRVRGKEREEIKEASSTRSSRRKSGNLAEVTGTKKVVMWPGFLKRGCVNEEFWKSRLGVG